MLTDVEKAILRLAQLIDIFGDLSVNSNYASVLLTRDDERALKIALEDLKEKPRGEWIEKPYGVVCSRCKSQALHSPNGNQLRSDFCPNCGASMRKEGEQKCGE